MVENEMTKQYTDAVLHDSHEMCTTISTTRVKPLPLSISCRNSKNYRNY